jgi:F-type H+-transporting ATPase subunit epsilon
MATKTIHVDIVSAEGEIFAGEAEMVFVPATEGELGITPRHAPLLTLIKAGEVRVKTADTAVRAHDLDEAAAIAAKQRAEEALASSEDKTDQAHALAELAQAAAQLKLLEKLRKTRG